MRVLIFHGYLLRGTGSNVFNASLAQALARLGHDVHLLCQDTEFANPFPDRIHLYRPDIGGLLPVYVLDEYEGFEVKAFSQLTDAELDRYLEANVAAVREVVDRAGGIDAALANHLVMGPAILARAGVRFAAKVHGSALEYTVKREPQRFLSYAREGMEAANAVLVGSRHTAESLWAALEMPELPAKTRLGPPGVDTELFSPVARDEAPKRLRDLAEAVLPRAVPPAGHRPRLPARQSGSSGDAPPPAPAGGAAWGRDPERAASAIDWFAEADGPRVVLVGKMIVSKGIDLALAAWPLVVTKNPGARLLIVGFGEGERGLLELWDAISRGELTRVREIAEQGRALEGGPAGRLRMLLAFLDSLPPAYAEAAKAAAGSVAFAGRLEHEEVGRLVPTADVLLFPSTFPEAFGMVAAEAAAAGVAPVSAAHSGAAEVSRELAAELSSEAAALVSFPLSDRAVADLADRINGWLALDPALGAEARERLRATASRRWSWEGVARGMLAAAAGRLDELPPVPQ